VTPAVPGGSEVVVMLTGGFMVGLSCLEMLVAVLSVTFAAGCHTRCRAGHRNHDLPHKAWHNCFLSGGMQECVSSLQGALRPLASRGSNFGTVSWDRYRGW
jgi:hypothetical protein